MNRKLDWLREAEAELSAAEDLAKGGHASWGCFTAPQSGEKAFKALILHQGRRAATHDLVDLMKHLSAGLVLPADVVKAASTLNRYCIPTRYPDAFASGAPRGGSPRPQPRRTTK